MPSSRRATTVSPSRGYRPETDHRNPKNAEQRPRSAPILRCQMPSALMQGNNTNHVQTTKKKKKKTGGRPQTGTIVPETCPDSDLRARPLQIKLALGARGSGRWHAGFLSTLSYVRLHRPSEPNPQIVRQTRKTPFLIQKASLPIW